MSWRCCVSLWKRKYFVWTSNRGHNYKSLVKLYLQHCSRTVQPKYYSVCSTFYGRLFPEPGRVAYNAGLHKGCFYKVGQFQLCKDSLALLTHSKYVFIFEEFASDDSNASFEQCRVVLDVCCFSDHKRRHGNVYAARCYTTVIIISNYVATRCNKCLVYCGFYCFCVLAPGHAITIQKV